MNNLKQFCDERQLEVLNAVEAHPGQKAAARALGISTRQVRNILEKVKIKAAAQGWSPKHDMTKTVPDGFHVKGVSSHYNEDGELTAQWVKSQKDIEEESLQVVEEALKERFARVKPLAKIAAPRKKLMKDILSVIVLSDAHLGLYAWGEETGQDWGLDVARRMIVGAVKYLVDAAPPSEEALIVNLGDYLHTDNLSNTTPKGGHHQDADARWPKVVAVGIDAFISCIDFALAKHRRVRVISKAGNHDMHAGIMMGIALRQAYRDNKRVIFDDTPSEVYSYLRFGNVLLGVTHGDRRVKPAELPLIMATDRSDDWGASKYRYWYTGHLHHQRKFEPTGGNCTVETFRIMSGRDAWHHGSGYRAGREMQSIILHREYGESGRTVVTPDMLRSVV